jgi:hypothetical protein
MLFSDVSLAAVPHHYSQPLPASAPTTFSGHHYCFGHRSLIVSHLPVNPISVVLSIAMTDHHPSFYIYPGRRRYQIPPKDILLCVTLDYCLSKLTSSFLFRLPNIVICFINGSKRQAQTKLLMLVALFLSLSHLSVKKNV